MDKKKDSPRSKVIWSLLFAVIAGLTVYTIVSQSKSFSLDTFRRYLHSAYVPWLLCACGCSAGFVLFEGQAVRAVTRGFGYGSTFLHGTVWSASDIYFSAITPSATGGQPVCAWFMVKDGVPALMATVALIMNLAMYTASIIFISVLTVVIDPRVFMAFGTVSKVLIVIGFLIQAGLMAFFLLLLTHNTLMHRICRGGLHLLCSLRILKHEERRQAKLSAHMADYAEYAKLITGHRQAMSRCFLYNLLQRACIISVPFFVYLASGGGLRTAARVWAVQCCTVLGSNTVPIPGAMLVSDYIMLDGFADLIPAADVVDFELLSRAISFYCCVLICGAVTLAAYLIKQKRDKS